MCNNIIPPQAIHLLISFQRPSDSLFEHCPVLVRIAGSEAPSPASRAPRIESGRREIDGYLWRSSAGMNFRALFVGPECEGLANQRV